MRHPKFRYIFVILLVTSCAVSSATLKIISLESAGEKYEGNLIHIDFCENFSGELVTLKIDGIKVFSKKLSTPNDGTGFTDSITYEKSSSKIQIDLTIEGSEWNTSLKTGNGLFLCIMHENSIPFIEQSESPIYYD